MQSILFVVQSCSTHSAKPIQDVLYIIYIYYYLYIYTSLEKQKHEPRYTPQRSVPQDSSPPRGYFLLGSAVAPPSLSPAAAVKASFWLACAGPGNLRQIAGESPHAI